MKERLYTLIKGILGEPEEGFSEEQRFIEDLGGDSLDVIEIVLDAEDEFCVLISDDVAGEWKTIKDVVNWLVDNATQLKKHRKVAG